MPRTQRNHTRGVWLRLTGGSHSREFGIKPFRGLKRARKAGTDAKAPEPSAK
jgi:hypothetical protein